MKKTFYLLDTNDGGEDISEERAKELLQSGKYEIGYTFHSPDKNTKVVRIHLKGASVNVEDLQRELATYKDGFKYLQQEQMLILTYNPMNLISIAFVIERKDFSKLKEEIKSSQPDDDIYEVYAKYSKTKLWCNETDESLDSFIIDNTSGLDTIQIFKIVIEG